MKILGIETASDICSVALVENGALVSERSRSGLRIHSEHLLPMIDELLQESELEPADLDCVVVSIGPGSFTGLRIGLSTAKGLVYAASKPLVAIPTLEALAFNALRAHPENEPSVVLAILDSRRGECFAGVFGRPAHDYAAVVPAGPYTYGELAALLVERQSALKGCRMTGPGADKFFSACREMHEPIQELIETGLKPFPAAERGCSSAAVALLGERKFLTGSVADTAELEPEYMKVFFTTALIHTTD